MHRYLYPAFTNPPKAGLLIDQYAFRPIRSTTSALISIPHQVSRPNNYVTLVSLDFTKAFDMVRRSTPAAKLSCLELPDNIYSWLVEFLNDRHHPTRYRGMLLTVATIIPLTFRALESARQSSLVLDPTSIQNIRKTSSSNSRILSCSSVLQ